MGAYVIALYTKT